MIGRRFVTAVALAAAVGGTVVGVLVGGGGSAGAASAATTTEGPEFAITGTIAGTSTTCTSHWKWVVFHNLIYGSDDYSKVEWTSNPCGFAIQDRSWCFYSTGAHFDSGIVTRTNLWDQASCEFRYPDIYWAQQRFRNGSTWSAWRTYWGSPNG